MTYNFSNIIVRRIQDVSRFSDRSSKKDLSNNSNDGEISKKPREGSTSSDNPDDLLTESLKDPDCVALLPNCIKKTKKQITQIFDNTDELKGKQIKGESHLQELSDAVDFITKKFDKYKHERKEREEITNNLTENVAKLIQKVDDLSEAVEKQEKCLRRNCLLLHGIPERKQESTDELCIKAINQHLDLDINDRDIDRTHRIGNPRNTDEKSRPIIIILVRYYDRKKIFDSKKKLKGKKIAITESLTVARIKKLNEARKRYNFKNGWTSDRKILYKDGSEKVKIYYD